MWVRQKIGRTAGAIVEMPYEAAQAAMAAGNVVEVTDEELQKAGFPSQASVHDIPADKLLAEYRIEPSKEGPGFDIFEPGGVQINDMPVHNQAAARDEAHRHARASHGLAPLPEDHKSPNGDGKPGKASKAAGVADTDYESMSNAALDKMAAERGVDLAGAHSKAERVAMLRRAEEIRVAVDAGDYDGLTRAELEKVAAGRNVDISQANSKADVVAALKK